MTQDFSKDITFLSFEKATNPDGLVEVYRDRWWIVDPDKGLAIYKQTRPQCNSNEALIRRLAAMYPWCEVRFIPLAFVEVDPRDY